MTFPRARHLAGALAVSVCTVSASPLVNEIHFSPAHAVGTPEPLQEEWIELHNPDPTAVDVSGWSLTNGVTFVIPSGTVIAGNGYLVIAANVAAFQAAHPGFSGTVVGGWTGRLANSGETIQLEDAGGSKANDVSYATEGDWGLRARGPLSFSHRGWVWENEADGGGKTLELVNPALGNGNGQNWAVSAAAGGTPGQPNSVASADVAPLVKDAHHKPDVPSSSQPVVVSCKLEDEGTAPTATLSWRVAGAGAFTTVPMTDFDGDGRVEATIAPQANLSVVEWYVTATDGATSRTWPAAARTSNPGVAPETFGQAANALYQVDDAFAAIDFTQPGNQPVYRLVMTPAERDELVQIGTTNGQEESEAQMNGTFVSHDGTGTKVRLRSAFRNRGFGSALGPPNNYHVSFPGDDRWNDRVAMALNCQYPHSQALGEALMARAGLATQEAAIVRVRVNGVDLAQSGSLMRGRYVRLEGRGGDWAENHFPNDPDGNLYRLDDHDPGATNSPPGNLGSGEFRHEGTNPAAYADTFFKETNKTENDYSDLAQFTKVVSAPVSGGSAAQPAIADADYPAAVAQVLDLDEFYRFIAADALIGNQEGGLQSGRADDASIYSGLIDPRFKFIPHDLDDVFDIGNGSGSPVTRSIFSYDYAFGGSTPGTGVEGLTRLFNHPQLVPRYYAALLAAMDDWFNRATVDPIVDTLLQGWIPATDGNPAAPNAGIAEIKAFVDARRTAVLAEIQQNYSLAVTGNAADSPEGYKVTTTGAATLSGTFNVARTYSVTVNGTLAQTFYRTSGADAAGTWKLVVPAGGGGVLHAGLNNVVVQFWDEPAGAGNVLQTLQAMVLSQPVAPVYTDVSGTLTPPGTLTLLAPPTYVPGVPFLVRVDLRDAEGALDRGAWNSTVTLTATNGVSVSPSTVTLYNGIGSALVSFGSTTGGGSVDYFTYGSGGSGSTTSNTGTVGSTWRYRGDFTSATLASFASTVGNTWRTEGFDDSSWPSIVTHTGYGDGDENRAFTRVDYDPAAGGTQSGPVALFRSTFDVSDVSQLASVTGQVKFDDTCAVYVNGTEVFRHGDLTPNAPLTEYSETTTGTTRENATAALTVPVALLHDGTNTIAVEVHQHDAGSSDITFDLRLAGNLLSSTSDPGDFSLNASLGALNAQKSLVSAGANPAVTTASGALPAGLTTWSGIVQVTGDVTVPSGATLQIAPGTVVLMNATDAAGDTAGADLIVSSGGTLAIAGTAASPVSITSSSATGRWGQIHLNGANPTVCSHALIARAGHAPGVGHTSKGPVWRLTGANLTFNDSAMGDSPAKALYSSGTCDFVMQRSLMARMITGPEVEDGCSILIEDSNIQQILPHYRESNDAVPDDEDCLYVHNGTGRPVVVRRSVFARCGDDVFDCLGGPITVEDSILREGWDKGMSLLNNDLTISRTLIVDCDKAIVPKSNSATTRVVNADRCTMYSENHDTTLAPWGYSVPPSAPDADSPSTGFYTQNKAGQSNAGATLAITATNCIVLAEAPVLVDAPYDPVHTVVTYSITRDTDTPSTPAWTGTGNSNADPLFVSLVADNFHLQASSPAVNAGDPASSLDPDGTRADMGALPYDAATAAGGGELVWSLAGSPYRVTANTTVPSGLTLRIDPGVAVYFAQNARLTVNGRILAEGSPTQRITFSHVPGTNVLTDVDPIKLGTQTGAPKWGGIRVYDSMAQENVIRYCDFINAQGTGISAPENYGSIGFIRSWGWVDHCTWAGTHLRMCYGRNSKLTVTYNNFPDMFIFDPALGRIEEPTNDFIAAADNNMEPLKVEFPTTDAEVSGANAANFPNGLPRDGHWRVYFNEFHGNRGHQDVFDADSGRWAARDAVTNLQSNGQFVLDCRFNHFYGRAGDEHIDLGGDAYIASNVFENGGKDFWTNDTGYSNAISSGDKGTGTTILLARNVCYGLDHVINCKASTATIFEHNTVADLNPDFVFVGQTVTQNVVCAPINFFIPGDGGAPTNGDGAYLGYNIISNVSHVFSGPDASSSGPVTTKIEFFHNLLDQIADPVIGPNHPGGFFSGTYGPNTAGAPGFTDRGAEDYSLAPGSAAAGTAPGGLDYGASVPEWAYVLNAPPAQTPSTSAAFTVGGPGIVAYKWRLDGGAWSAPVLIGSGGVMPRNTPTVRQATLSFPTLANGPHTLEVLGQDMAGNWQDADPARTFAGLPQLGPTTVSWTVDSALQLVQISEVAANAADGVDWIELYNAGAAPIDLGGWSLSDQPSNPGKWAIPAGTVIASGGYLKIDSTVSGIALDKDGDDVLLSEGATLRDSVSFGAQPLGYTIGRTGVGGGFVLGSPTPAAANAAVPLGPPTALRINEWLASGEVVFKDDWIELANTGALPVSLTGLSLTDNRAGNAAAHVFPALSFVGPGAAVAFVADGKSDPGHVGLRLDSLGERIALLSGATLLDEVSFYDQIDDYSQSASTGGPLWYELPTYGFANGTSHPDYANALAILRGLRITEIMFNPVGGNNFEFIELTNTGATPLNLEGVSFVQGIDFTFGAFTLGAGESTVLVTNETAFRSRYGSAPDVAGTYVGRLDNAGETLALALPPPFTGSTLCFDYADGWYPLADGGGRSLELVSTATPANQFGDREAWNASAEVGGSPDGVTVAPPQSYTQWKAYYGVPSDAADNDDDGILPVMEYALGLDPQRNREGDNVLDLPWAVLESNGRLLLMLELPVTAAPQGHGVAEIVYEVQVSDSLGGWTTIATKTPTTAWTGAGVVTLGTAADGKQPVTIEDVAGLPAEGRRFIRLNVTWQP